MFFLNDKETLAEKAKTNNPEDSLKEKEIKSALKEGSVQNVILDYLGVEINKDPLTGDLVPFVYIKLLETGGTAPESKFVKMPLQQALLIGKMAEDTISKFKV